ncbi:MAG: type II CRISPR RNA-guided endonuclease Cas9 [Lachnospiraceae bacterium]|nr:type II CRISPR RNA-guided endonuclease Cas9 [Lachnospiraceae bacterium]
MDKALIEAALGKRPVDMLIRNGKLINVISHEIYDCEVSIYDGKIAGVGDIPDGAIGPDTVIIDAKGMYLAPGFFDAHIHFESSMLSYTEFAKMVIRHGTTAVASDLMEITIVSGLEGMTLLTEMGVFRSNVDEYKDMNCIPVDAADEELLNPVVRRSVRISFRVVNALQKKYEDISDVVIEMPRDRNSDEQKQRITDEQKRNENEAKEIEKKLAVSYDIKLTSADYSSQKQLGLKLKLWNEQDGKCLYSGKDISPRDILVHPEMFEIDHIIPRSISFDDSRSNKVLVYRDENQNKKNETPYFYLMHNTGKWTADQYRAYWPCDM